MAVTFACPECQKVLKSSAARKKIKCPKCQTVFPIPDEDDEEPRPSSAIREKKNGAAPTRRPAVEDNGEEDEIPAKAKSKASGITAKGPGPKSRATDDDDVDRDEEDEEEDRPRKKKKNKNKKKKSGSGMMIGLIAGGVGLILILGFVMTAFIWPGFLRSIKVPPGEGKENLLAFVPAKVDFLASFDRGFMKIHPALDKSLDQSIAELTAHAPTTVPPALIQVIRDADKFLVAANLETGTGTYAFIMKSPYKPEKMKASFKAGSPVAIQGKRCYRITTGGKTAYLAMPNDRLIVWTEVGETEVSALMACDGVTPAAGSDLVNQARDLQSKSVWAVIGIGNKVKQKTREKVKEKVDEAKKNADAIAAIAGPLVKTAFKELDKQTEQFFQMLDRTKSASAWFDLSGKSLNVGLSLGCGTDSDAAKIKTDADVGKSLASTVVPTFAKQFQAKKEDLDLFNEVLSGFQTRLEGARVTLSLQFSEKTNGKNRTGPQEGRGTARTSRRRWNARHEYAPRDEYAPWNENAGGDADASGNATARWWRHCTHAAREILAPSPSWTRHG